ncbi:MAG: hypothetical protein AAF725_19095, partial [Acidobacteriota bacterium]
MTGGFPPAARLGDGACAPAAGKPRCRVVLDLRSASWSGAVAAGPSGGVCAWAWAPNGGSGDERWDGIARLVRSLEVKATDLAVLIGGAELQALALAEPPEGRSGRLEEIFSAEGFEAPRRAATAQASAAGGAIAARCDEADLASRGEQLGRRLGLEPRWLADVAILAQPPEDGARGESLQIEIAGNRATFVALGADREPAVRERSGAA